MEEKNLVTLLSSILIFSLLFANTVVAAGLYVKPAKLGVIHLETLPYSSAEVTNSFEVGNRYVFPIKIELGLKGNITNITTLSENSFNLKPNETRTIDYSVSVKEPGIYTGGVTISVSSENRTSTLAYQADLTVIVTKGKMSTGVVAPIIIVTVLVAIILIYSTKRWFIK
ncbi:MAG: hypothetical protein QXO27_04305 [Candidatus Aenigmatarchaeota archaeon]